MLQPGVHDLLDSEEVGTEQIALFIKALVHSPFQIIQALVIDENADKYCQRRQSSTDGRNDYLSEGAHASILPKSDPKRPNLLNRFVIDPLAFRSRDKFHMISK